MKRNSSLELLRIISMLLIIIFHFCGRAYDLFSPELLTNNNTELSKLLFHSLGQTGVPIFMFISGFYGIKFKYNRLINMFIQCVLYTIVLYSLSCLIRPGLWNTRIFILNIFGPSTLWFFYCYVVIYIFADPINDYLNGLSFKKFTAIILLLLYFSVGLWFMKSSALNIFSLFEFYIIARYTKLHLYTRISQYAVWTVIPSIVLFLLPVFIGWHFNCIDKIQPYVNKYYNPFILPICITLIISADKHAFYNKYVNKFASTALACYLIHESSYFSYFIKPFFHFEEYSILRILFTSIGIYLFCYIIDKIRITIGNLYKYNEK